MTNLPINFRSVRRVCVTGGRNYNDQAAVDRALDDVFAQCLGTLTVVHGGASGADACAHAWVFATRARGAHVGVDVYMAEWRKLGVAAGPFRNSRMLAVGRPDLVLAFPGDKGTADCVKKAQKLGIPVLFCGQPQEVHP